MEHLAGGVQEQHCDSNADDNVWPQAAGECHLAGVDDDATVGYQIVARAEKRRARAVLQPAVALTDSHGKEQVALHRCTSPLRIEERDLLAADRLQVAHETGVPVGGGAGRPKARVRVGKLKSGKPRVALRLRAASTPIARARVRLPRGLKVGAKHKLLAGAHVSGGSVRGHGRRLSIRAEGGGADRIGVRLAKGAVKARKDLRAKRLKPFAVTIVDTDGTRTKLTPRAAG